MTSARVSGCLLAVLAITALQGLNAAPPRATAVGEPAPAASPVHFVPVSEADRNKPLGVGDQVTVQIVEDRTEPFVRRVTDAGDIDVPYIGRVRAVGKTAASLAAEIERLLEKDFYHEATVRLAIDQVNRATAAGRVYVSGEVRAPGAQEFFPEEKLTVGGVILKAGGFTQFANKRKVKLVRKSGQGTNQEFEVDMKAVLEDGQVQHDMQIRDGDYVIVNRRLINW